MKYYSTNRQAPETTLSEAVIKGLAPDKGLYMPERISPLPPSFFDHIEDLSLQEIAFQVAQAFLREKGKTVQTIDMPRKGKSMAKQGNAAYYVFNNGDSDGFVIVSGDDRTEQVLGYSLDGHIDDGNIPENLKWVLEGYERQISHLQEDSGGSIAQGPMNAPKALVSRPVHNSILLKTPYWDQGNNRMTPEIDGEHCLTGCVATAMAEIMAYHRWPQKRLGENRRGLLY